MSRATNIVVMGIGNLLCADDGVGVHAVRELETHRHATEHPITFVDAGTAILHALSFAEAATHLLVIDAVRAGGAPGDLYEFDGYEMTAADDVQSLHSLGLKQALEFVEPEKRPGTFTVLGVEPEAVEYGTELSSPVHAALPDVAERVGRVVSKWTIGEDRKQL